MKSIILTLTLLLSLNLYAGTNDQAYIKSVELSDKIDQLDYNLSPAQFLKIKNLLDQIDMVLTGDPSLQCEANKNIFREIFAWARSTEGLNQSRQAAEDFAEVMSKKPCATKYFETFKVSFAWARSSEGLNKSRGESEVFSTEIAQYQLSKGWATRAMDCIQDEFTFARSSEGLNMSRSEAEEFSKNRCLK